MARGMVRLTTTAEDHPTAPAGPAAVPPLPEQGQIVNVRGAAWAVADVRAQGLPRSPADEGEPGLTHVVQLQSLEEDRLDEELSVVWELEVGQTVAPDQGLPEQISPAASISPESPMSASRTSSCRLRVSATIRMNASPQVGPPGPNEVMSACPSRHRGAHQRTPTGRLLFLGERGGAVSGAFVYIVEDGVEVFPILHPGHRPRIDQVAEAVDGERERVDPPLREVAVDFGPMAVGDRVEPEDDRVGRPAHSSTSQVRMLVT